MLQSSRYAIELRMCHFVSLLLLSYIVFLCVIGLPLEKYVFSLMLCVVSVESLLKNSIMNVLIVVLLLSLLFVVIVRLCKCEVVVLLSLE
jgi:hypothetical protein